MRRALLITTMVLLTFICGCAKPEKKTSQLNISGNEGQPTASANTNARWDFYYND